MPNGGSRRGDGARWLRRELDASAWEVGWIRLAGGSRWTRARSRKCAGTGRLLHVCRRDETRARSISCARAVGSASAPSRFRVRRAHSHRTFASKTPLDDRAHCRFRSSDRSAHLSRCAPAPSRESSRSTRSRMQVYRDRRVQALGPKVGDALGAGQRRERCERSAMVRVSTMSSARRRPERAIAVREKREQLE